jgi:hypothetical protein
MAIQRRDNKNPRSIGRESRMSQWLTALTLIAALLAISYAAWQIVADGIGGL